MITYEERTQKWINIYEDYLAGFSYKEIADHYHYSVSWVRLRISELKEEL